jgi:hypothetical protein
MDLPRNALRYFYLLDAGALARDPKERDRLVGDWTPEERARVAEECNDKARLYAVEAERLTAPPGAAPLASRSARA